MNPDYEGTFWINDIDRHLISFYNKLRADMKGTIDKIEKKMAKKWKGSNKEFSKYLRHNGTGVEKLVYRSMNCDTYNYEKGSRKIANFREKIPEYEELFGKCKFKEDDVTLFNVVLLMPGTMLAPVKCCCAI